MMCNLMTYTLWTATWDHIYSHAVRNPVKGNRLRRFKNLFGVSRCLIREVHKQEVLQELLELVKNKVETDKQ